eukprot:gnl/Trimastix_PCT/2550.p1 GENE.gnl/Trimastix_PCT/2550~~gnl/Trimastix_PCT/2550.p1  ORF type:complete len:461 (+),score=77.38 gnl/Trimastix_PCT/2550:70-1383(+)
MAEEPELQVERKDRYKFVYLIFILLGMGSLAAWNSFLTAVDFFKGYFGESFQFTIGFAYNAGAVPTMLLMILIGHKLRIGPRVHLSFIVTLIILCISPFITRFINAKVSLYLMLILIGITGIGSGLLCSSLFSLGAQFPPKYTQALMAGQGVVGIVVAIIRVITKLVLPGKKGLMPSTIIYFALAGVLNLFCMLGYWGLRHIKFSRYYLNKAEAGAKSKKPKLNEQEVSSINGDSLNDPLMSGPGVEAGLNYKDEESLMSRPKVEIKQVFKALSVHAPSVVLVFWITLFLYPGVTCSILPLTPALQKEGWFPVLLITCFALFDFIGRSLPSFFIMYRRRFWILTVSLLRLVFIPLFILSVHQVKIIKADPVAFLLVTALALTNGYHGTVTMIWGADVVRDHEKPIGGAIMSCFLNIGIFLGSLSAFIYSKAMAPGKK